MRRRSRALGAVLALVLLLSVPVQIAQASNPILHLPKPSPPHISDPEVPNSAWMGPAPTHRVEVDSKTPRVHWMARLAAWLLVHTRGGVLR